MPRIAENYEGMISNAEKRKEMQKREKKESDKLFGSQAMYIKT